MISLSFSLYLLVVSIASALYFSSVFSAPCQFLSAIFHASQQVYSKVSGESPLETPTIDVSSKEFYGEGYDDSDKRIPDMTIINRQLGIDLFLHPLTI